MHEQDYSRQTPNTINTFDHLSKARNSSRQKGELSEAIAASSKPMAVTEVVNTAASALQTADFDRNNTLSQRQHQTHTFSPNEHHQGM